MITIRAAARAGARAKTDPTIRVRPGARLDVNNCGGSIAVSTWAKSAVRVQAEHSSRDRVQVSGSEAVVSVKSTGRLGPSQVIDYTITVPVSMALALSGVYTDITVEGSQGEITAETVQGEVKVTGGSGFVSLRSVNGEVTLDKARGRITLNTVNEGITLRDASGDVAAETVNGDVRLELESFNGDIKLCRPGRLKEK